MKKMLLIAVGLMLSVVIGCVAIQPTAQNQTDPGTTIFEKLHVLKTQGCSALPELERELLVLLIKSRVSEYPANGICDPQWINDVLLNQIKLLESDDVSNESARMGHEMDSRYRQVLYREGASLFFIAFKSRDYRTQGLRNRPSIDTQDLSFVYASSVEVYSSGGSHTRLHLHGSVQRDNQSAS